MSLSIFDIAKGISWGNTNKISLTPKGSDCQILTEYINDVNQTDLEDEITQLVSFEKVRKSFDKKLIEEYIVNQLYGFDEYPDGYYCKIGGFDDFSVIVLYDFEQDKTFLKYNDRQEKKVYSIEDLIRLLEKVSILNKTVF